jgi:hypothetical protein
MIILPLIRDCNIDENLLPGTTILMKTDKTGPNQFFGALKTGRFDLKFSNFWEILKNKKTGNKPSDKLKKLASLSFSIRILNEDPVKTN